MKRSFFFLLLLVLTAPLPAQEKPTVPTRPRAVFALYMVCFFNNVEFYQQEYELAKRHGIDGFLLDFGSYNKGYEAAVERMFKAAEGTDFKFLMTPEYSVGTGDYPKFVKKYHKHPNWYRLDGKPVMAIYGGNQKAHHDILKKLKDEGYPVSYLGFYGGGRFVMSWSVETAQRLFRGYPLMDGLWHFSCDGQTGDLMRLNANARRATQFMGKRYMAGVCFAYNSANMRDHHGMHGYLSQWEAARRDGADLVSVITWNDYNEDSNLMPYRWQRGWGKQYYNRDEAVLIAGAYGSAYYKTGKWPAITQDQIFYTYRSRSQKLTKAWDETKKQWVDILSKQYPYDQIHADALDRVYITTVLTKPATVIAKVGKDQKLDAPAGVSHYELPMAPGVPTFKLERDGKVLLDVVGRREIIAKETEKNSPYGKHLSNRTWAGGAVVGPATRIEVKSAELLNGAAVADGGVRNLEKAGSGFKVAVKGVKTGTYNIRFRYRNAGSEDARLTLVADGPKQAPKQFPYYIPMFFPPTGKESATASVLWSLYDKTSFLQLTWEASVNPQARDATHRSNDDNGQVTVEAIELVKVDPVAMPQARTVVHPELVKIPGGTFELGSKDTEPDEAPVSKVTISTFAIGKYEVTNEEFERFMPEHRKFRDGYSWRDREPVIYIKWTEARDYCNWLSKQAGLKPVYIEKKTPRLNRKGKPVKDRKGNVRMKSEWTVDMSADGFRLPTEAEWEYVASGRGEERTYPWGNGKPVPQKHGNFMSRKDALSLSPKIRSQQAEGTMVVGSYPAGASRDGVMDLAGNVGEWVADWFGPYNDKAKKDPLNDKPYHYRSIRGSSWGYYGMGSRCSDREYNNPNYPGYIYLGFRVAISEAGYKKVNARQQ